MVEADAIVHPTNATFYLGGEIGMYQISCFLVTVQWNNDVTKMSWVCTLTKFVCDNSASCKPNRFPVVYNMRQVYCFQPIRI